jgi:two-component system sensor histidine kinase RpfC
MPSQTMRILIVDDSPRERRLLASVVEGLGLAAACVASGEEALNLCARERFTAILMDVHMSGMDGVETARTLRARPGWTQEAPIVAISAGMTAALIASARPAGIDACLAKPARPVEIAEALRTAFIARTAA